MGGGGGGGGEGGARDKATIQRHNDCSNTSKHCT